MEETNTNKSVIKALEIVDLLGQSNEPMHLNELSKALGLPESTVHRLLSSLMSKNYVQQMPFDGRYHLGWKIITLAHSLGILGQLPQILRPYLKTLARDTKQTVNLSILRGANIIYLDTIVPPDKVSLNTPVGTEIPAYASSMGKAIMAYLPQNEIDRIFASTPFQAFTPSTIISRDELSGALNEIREKCYAIDRGEYDEHVHCLGAPILDVHGTPIAGVSISIIPTNKSPDWYLEYVPFLLDACKRMSIDFLH